MASAIWLKYTAVQTVHGPSNRSDVMNRFGIFKFFAEQMCEGKAGRQFLRANFKSDQVTRTP